ncbi:GroES family chaperonin [Pseudactinotalea terrae]|uniref:GroES family chaperonin n=1 Tax=Pseudactinotalea terrae TaxID=1743262 RepID=UPI001F502D67|nr:co-chaperone GroES [Pseudactinotalea terrae]
MPGPTTPAGKLPIMMLHDRVLVQLSPDDAERKSSAGLVIPATAQMAHRLHWAAVLGVGPHVRTVKVGDQVLFGEEQQQEVEIQGETYVIVREKDLHAVAAARVEVSTGLYL